MNLLKIPQPVRRKLNKAFKAVFLRLMKGAVIGAQKVKTIKAIGSGQLIKPVNELAELNPVKKKFGRYMAKTGLLFIFSYRLSFI